MQQKSSDYILFIDSGMGGLSILQYFLGLHSDVNYIYYADTINFPYGTKTPQQIAGYLQNIYTNLNILYNIPMIVLACNTASVSALHLLRQMVKIPVVGTVPPVKPAAQLTRNNRIGIIATDTTVKLEYINELIDQFASDKKIFIKACPALVRASESRISDDELQGVLKAELSYFREYDIDTLVLGSTHYFFFYDEIVNYFSGSVSVVDSRDGVARRIASLMDDSYICIEPDSILFISNDNEQMAMVYREFNSQFSLFNSIILKDYSCL